ncbi:MAG TPA: S-adenosyl-l-methionine hydroxide adenosyltransferase family protein [Candidatus Bathyarchaeia archaeon]
MPKIITLTTDFGLKDPYAAEMKATILSISSDATIVDVTHGIAQFNIRMGAYVLASAAPYFPEGTIHVAVVDPGVGARRRPLLIQTRQSFFVGPDNGLLILAAEQQGIKCIREITNARLMLPQVSSTFHGRDVFAPAAAHLVNGVAPAEFGPEINDSVKPDFTKVTLREGVLIGEVLHVDNFGNIITNISSKEVACFRVAGVVNVQLPDQKLRLKLCKAYGEANPQEPLALIGSHNYLEIALNQGNAAEKFKVRPGDKIQLS